MQLHVYQIHAKMVECAFPESEDRIRAIVKLGTSETNVKWEVYEQNVGLCRIRYRHVGRENLYNDK